MAYMIGEKFERRLFLVRGVKKFDWGVIGTLHTREDGDIAFKFGKQEILGEDFDVGDILEVYGAVASYNGAPQIIGNCLKVDPTPEIAARLAPTTSVDVNIEFAFMMDEATRIGHIGLRDVTVRLLHDNSHVLIQMPAGMSMHHSYLGGWVEHTSGILRSALALQVVYKDKLNHDLLVAGSILHDIGKLYEFQRSSMGLIQDYSFLGEGLGHATIGVGMIMSCIESFGYQVAEPMFAALLNIVGTHAGRREWGACAECITKEAVVISNLDYVDAHINSIGGVLSEVSIGEKAFSKATRYNVYRTV